MRSKSANDKVHHSFKQIQIGITAFATAEATEIESTMKKEDLNFTIYCVGIVAESLGRDARDVYRLMQKGNIIMGYIVPCFDVLHSFSREYIVDDLTQLMKKKGLLAA